MRVALGAILALGGCSGARSEGLDPSKVPVDLQSDYVTFARRCSKCHSLARPLMSGISDDDQWSRYVNRMRRQPGSGISLDDQDHILRFLRWYAADLREREAVKRGWGPAGPAPTGSVPRVPLQNPATEGSPNEDASAPKDGG